MKLFMSLLVMLAVSLTGCSKQNAIPPIEDWITFNSPDAPYSALLPSKPKRQEQTVNGMRIALHLCDSNKNLVAVTSSNDMPIDIDINNAEQVKAVLDEAVKSGMSNQKAKVKEQRDLKLQGKYPCREVTATLKAPNGTEGTIRLRIVLLPKMLIQLLFIGDTAEMQAPQIKEALESLKIMK